MRAAPGAIEVVKLSAEGVELGVIGDVEPEGLCGSGLVDVVAELIQQSSSTPPDGSSPMRRPPAWPWPRLTTDPARRSAGLRAALAGDVGDVDKSIFRPKRDVRELQFAKAAIATGWHILLERPA